jgi:hypothetical protein
MADIALAIGDDPYRALVPFPAAGA